MKIIIIFFYLCLSLPVYSFPKLGDHARYLAQHQGSVYEIKKSLIEYNADKDTFIQVSKLSLNEIILDESVHELSSIWFYNPSKIENVLKTCVRREGALETLEISHQRISVCTFHDQDSQLDFSIGMVPFGQVRFQEYLGGGDFLDFYLVDFQSK